MIYFIKIQSKNMKMNWNIRLLIFCMTYNFVKCDGFTVSEIINLSYSMVLILLSFLCNHYNFGISIISENSYLGEECIFIDRNVAKEVYQK